MRKKRRYTRHTDSDKQFRHPRSTYSDPRTPSLQKTDPSCRQDDLFTIIGMLEDRIEQLERRQSHFHRLFDVVFGKISTLSRMHQHTRDIATKLRNLVSPISAKERENIRKEIEEKRIDRQEKEIAEALERAAKAIKKQYGNKDLVSA